jgi:glycosyltransferase involved in cell wall biosynthesis
MLPITISIVIPIYKVEKYIEKCISAIIDQSYDFIEIILVNDGSPDESLNIAEKLLQKYKIKYTVLNQKNSGVSVARNLGIAKASGEWVICIDSDDKIDRDMIYKMVNKISEHPEANAIFCDFQVVTVGEEDIGPQWNLEYQVYSSFEAVELFFRREAVLIAPALLVKKEFLQNNFIIYDEDCFFAEDDLYVWKVLTCCEHVIHIKEPLYNYVRHSGSTMTSSSVVKFYSGYTTALEVYKEFIKSPNIPEHYAQMFIPRHVFGILHAAAKVLDYKDFKSLSEKMRTKEFFQTSISLHDLKVRILMKIFHVNERLYYSIMRKF